MAVGGSTTSPLNNLQRRAYDPPRRPSSLRREFLPKRRPPHDLAARHASHRHVSRLDRFHAGMVQHTHLSAAANRQRISNPASTFGQMPLRANARLTRLRSLVLPPSRHRLSRIDAAARPRE